jgi:hypothetical protein
MTAKPQPVFKTVRPVRTSRASFYVWPGSQTPSCFRESMPHEALTKIGCRPSYPRSSCYGGCLEHYGEREGRHLVAVGVNPDYRSSRSAPGRSSTRRHYLTTANAAPSWLARSLEDSIFGPVNPELRAEG